MAEMAKDKNWRAITEKEEAEDYLDNNYKTNPKDISQYKLVEVTGDEEGQYQEETQTVIYYYEKLKGKVIAKYLEKGTDKESALPFKFNKRKNRKNVGNRTIRICWKTFKTYKKKTS